MAQPPSCSVLPHPMAPAVDVPGTVGKVVGLTLALVETDAQRQVWNTLMAYEHPRGAGPFEVVDLGTAQRS